MAQVESSIVCPACRIKTVAPPSRDGALFSCGACQARLRWRFNGSKPLLELLTPAVGAVVQKPASGSPRRLSTGTSNTPVDRRQGQALPAQNPRSLSDFFTGNVQKYLIYSVSGVALLAVISLGLSSSFENDSLREPSAEASVSGDLSPETPVRETTVEEANVQETPKTRAELIAAFEPSVCKILTPESNGTGFLVAPNLIATNKHVVGCWDTKYLQAEFLNSSTSLLAGTEAAWVVRNIEFAYATEGFDLCFLRAESIPPSCQPIPPAKMERLVRGQEVIIIGCPYGQEGTITPGVLNQLRNDVDAQPLLSLSAAVNPGNSGGPVITLFGEAAGVVVLKHGMADGIGYAVPASAVSESLKNLAMQSSSEATQNISRFLCQQATTAILISTLETHGLLSPQDATKPSDESIARISNLLPNTHTLIQSAESSGGSQAAISLLKEGLAQAELVFQKVQSGSEQGLTADLELLARMNEQLKSETGYLDFELP